MAETPRSRRETAPSSRVCRPPFLMAAVVYTTRKPEAIFEAPSTLVRDCSLPLSLAVKAVKLEYML
ncbi:hypothetical protein Lalb_Chr06g0173311 [Lupinus albus]|uniref:Uncharacterized protein n=1 Tax=Lupinus albus TaxID=3870 RepID=A0A6A4QG43_LUPAL|nr:hypothetical protein Lalb_Chr06g0173311 [Lupinus albus]